ncbi:hypothetical protein SNEBB_010362 [Seison nebaliae]|nr:hypothetical protein SNEBB_010362 [Seison nebaliae]
MYDPRIVDGMESKQGTWPWMASIKRFGTQYCGGTVVHERLVITAAHCFKGRYDKSSYRVIIGTNDISSSTKRMIFRIDEVIIHENYPESRYYDIAVIKLSGRIPLVKQIKSHYDVMPICFVPIYVEFVYDSKCYIMGWGAKKYGQSLQVKLREARVKIMNDKECKRIYPNVNMEYQFCGEPSWLKEDSCQGDSGGPLICRKRNTKTWYFVGITSYGKKCGIGSVYVKVSAFIYWIESVLRRLKITWR